MKSVFSTVLATLLLAAGAEASLTACVVPAKGKLRLATEKKPCKAGKEVTMILAEVSDVSEGVEASPPGGLNLFTADGVDLGPVVSSSGVFVVAHHPVDDLQYRYKRDAGYLALETRTVFFESADCSGTAYLDSTEMPGQVFDTELGATYAIRGAGVTMRNINSRMRFNAPCEAFFTSMSALPTAQTSISTTSYQAPMFLATP